MVYDAANRHLIVANRARNRVEIFSTLDGSRVGSVDVAGASSADLSPDRRTVWVEQPTEQIAAIDTSGATLTIRGSGFQSGASVSIGAKTATVTFVDIDTIKITAPSLPAGTQRVVVSNPDGESTSWDAAFTAN